MNKVILSISIAAILIISVCVVIVGLLIFSQPNVNVSNVRISYRSEFFSGYYLSFTAVNEYSSPVTAIGIAVNGENNGVQASVIPPGQTQDISTQLITSNIGPQLTVKIIFTFDDGKYIDYTTTVQPQSTQPPTPIPTPTFTEAPVVSTKKISIQGVSYNSGVLTVYTQLLAGDTTVINGLIVKDASGNTVVIGAISGGSVTLSSSALTTITAAVSLTSGVYTVTLTTVTGGNYISPSFIA